MNIYLNGVVKNVTSSNIDQLLREVGVAGRFIAVTKNSAIVKKSSWGETSLEEDDKIDIISLVGGG
mgnify:CR=1 FL=1